MDLIFFLLPMVIGIACVLFGFWRTIMFIVKFGATEEGNADSIKQAKNKQWRGVFAWATGVALLVYFIESVPFVDFLF